MKLQSFLNILNERTNVQLSPLEQMKLRNQQMLQKQKGGNQQALANQQAANQQAMAGQQASNQQVQQQAPQSSAVDAFKQKQQQNIENVKKGKTTPRMAKLKQWKQLQDSGQQLDANQAKWVDYAKKQGWLK